MPEFNSTRAENLVGAKFGKWLVVSKSAARYFGGTVWVCRCSCGRTREIPRKTLIGSRSSACVSCAAKRRGGRPVEDLSGRKFGTLTAVSFSHCANNRSRTKYWMCRCDCGFHEVKSAYKLKVGKTGCTRCKYRNQERAAFAHLWHASKRRARIANLEFSLERDWLQKSLEEQGYRCALTGIEITVAIGRTRHMHRGTTASMDRKDASRGYTPENTQWVHKTVNRMKWTLTNEEFIEICRNVVRTHGNE